mmetsp:Transcript_41931/g.131057  ORF Transcript_41931/g.131057 Transcript_41931/m.131057 type:complete len:204 (+) Transcript_41931:246-857(+)
MQDSRRPRRSCPPCPAPRSTEGLMVTMNSTARRSRLTTATQSMLLWWTPITTWRRSSTSGAGARASTSRTAAPGRPSASPSSGTSTTSPAAWASARAPRSWTAAAGSAGRRGTSPASLALRSRQSPSTSSRWTEATPFPPARACAARWSLSRLTSCSCPSLTRPSTASTRSSPRATHPTARRSTARSSACSSPEPSSRATSGA